MFASSNEILLHAGYMDTVKRTFLHTHVQTHTHTVTHTHAQDEIHTHTHILYSLKYSDQCTEVSKW